MIGRKLPAKDGFTQVNTYKADSDGLMRFNTLIRQEKHGEEVPTLFYLPKNWNKQVAIWIHDEGKDALLSDQGQPVPVVQKLIDAGIAVALPDLIYQGESLADGQSVKSTRTVPNPRQFLGYTQGYNHSLFSQRVHDILAVIAFCRFSKYEPAGVHLIGLGKQCGVMAAAAAVQAGQALDKIAIGTSGFRFGSITDIRDPMLVSGAVRYGDVPGLLALAAPRQIWLADEPQIPALTEAAYQAAGARRSITTYLGDPRGAADAAANWLIG